MKLFIWTYLDALTGNFHSGGGLAVIASDLERAKALARAEGVEFLNDDREALDYNLADEPGERVFLFPDAGCC